ncbi:MAG: imidazoleglycerol-phosphate dehydratase HisB [Lachnospiraceae bacterium]|nr:imidazoleglycerol-phosphate dehydratase HisB [Lachnospiraceae bacterium]
MSRFVRCERDTRETEIVVELNLDGTGEYDIDTGIGFFDHMLEGFARHGLFDLTVSVHGDTHVDAHHTVEDTGIVLGQAFLEALGDKEGISRFGYFVLPMDDALVLASLDFSGRTFFSFEAEFAAERLGAMETETVREFFMGLASGAQMNLHIRQLAGENTHHIVEAMFKAVAKSMDMASQIDGRIDGVLSTKGVL